MSPHDVVVGVADAADLMAAGAACADADALVTWAGPVFTFPFDPPQARHHLEGFGPDDLALAVVSATDPADRVAYLELLVTPSQGLGRVCRVLVHPGWRGRGVCGVVMRHVLAVAFDDRGLERVELAVFDGNASAQRCYEAVGFRVEGRLRSARRLSSGRVDAVLMGVLREEWAR